jgi:hypothetical protein
MKVKSKNSKVKRNCMVSLYDELLKQFQDAGGLKTVKPPDGQEAFTNQL